MNDFHKAATLAEVPRVVDLAPLAWGDPRYADIAAGRGGSNELRLMSTRLTQCDASDNHFAKIAFTGHRGSGKSTELLRLEHELSDRFTSLHLKADDALIDDYDYTNLFLWLADELVRKFENDGTPLDHRLAAKVANWFAAVTSTQTDQVKSAVDSEAEGKAGAKASLLGISLGIFARLKSSMVGSTERRTEIRRELQKRSDELVENVNLLLDNAQKALRDHGKPADLLIVVDNLDRLSPAVSRPLFFNNGDTLKRLRAHVIYTVPIASDLAPMNIGTVFEDKFTLSMVKVRKPGGKADKPGIDALAAAVAKRVEVDAVFGHSRDVRRLAEMSGGSVRDLMRLVQSAQLIARADGKDRIDAAAVREAVLRMRLDFERLLIPGRAYYPILARIHRSNSDGCDVVDSPAPDEVQKARDFFKQLLFNGSVLEYNGGRMWYDVHPVIQEIGAFRRGLGDAENPPQTATPA